MDQSEFPLRGRTLAMLREEGAAEKRKAEAARTAAAERKVPTKRAKLKQNADTMSDLSPDLPVGLGAAEDWRMARSLSHLAAFFRNERKYPRAEALYREALKIQERLFGPKHAAIASNLNNLARLYQEQGRYAEAESFYTRSLAIVEELFGPTHPKTARRIGNLIEVYCALGKYPAAEDLYRRLGAIAQNSPDEVRGQIEKKLKAVAVMLNNRAARL